MAELGATKGPYQYRNGTRIYGATGIEVAQVSADCGSLVEARSNAHLLAASWEMYEALDLLYDKHCDGVFSLPDEHYIAITKAAAALSKARGEATS